MVTVTDILGNSEPLLVSELHIENTLCQVGQLDFTTWNTDENKIGYDMLTPRAVITVPETGQMYRLSENDGADQGQYRERTLTALPVIQDLNDHYVRGTLTGSQTLDACMHFITDGTKFSFTIHGDMPSFNFTDNFGAGHALDLFLNTLITNFQWEFTFDNYHLDLFKQIGRQDAFVLVDGDDLHSLEDSADYTTITTQVHGEGKMDDNNNPTVQADYVSPNAAQFGYIDADPYQDDNVTDVNVLKGILPSKVQDFPLVEFTATLVQFSNLSVAGSKNDITVGNYGYLRSRSGVDVKIRISSSDLYPQSSDNDSTVTFGNLKLEPAAITARLQAARDSSGREIEDIKKALASSNANALPMITDQDALSHLAQIGGE
ncbi:hypothetical protein LROSL1_1200 [Furfurilactobacillus rossiae]|uniref:prophage endopeptidase tail family protein n=1 Tax=Furfurilactobacillus rossiae TaxID=231049 RepID=UPI0015B9799B|nr:prophage endopeptidase tail family protein [Furfurilactobacillus rossiae]QLE64017.1 hypothetical protein LROSL1_1200 [Furfurilactobacillus rossiae]